MEKEKSIKLKIEKLKDQKENLKFGYSKIMIIWIGIMIFLATTAITLSFEMPDIIWKIGSLVVFLIVIILSGIGFNTHLSKRAKKLEELAKEIQNLYDQLLK